MDALSDFITAALSKNGITLAGEPEEPDEPEEPEEPGQPGASNQPDELCEPNEADEADHLDDDGGVCEPPGEGELVVVREPGVLAGPYPKVDLVVVAGIQHLAAAWADRAEDPPVDLEKDLHARFRQRFGDRLPTADDTTEDPPPSSHPPDGTSVALPSCLHDGTAWLERALSPYGAPARLEHVGLVDAPTLDLLACNAVIRTALLTPSGALLDVGRAQRLATPGQKTALLARDGGCVIPGCAIPGDACDAHHVIWWSRGGATDVGNLVLVCSRHHDEIHQGTWAIEMQDGVPWVASPRWANPFPGLLRNAVHHPSPVRRSTPVRQPVEVDVDGVR